MFELKEIGLAWDVEKVFVSSDHHFLHKNIIEYADRSYADLDEMEADVIRRHNAAVPEKGSLWICLGDFMMVRRSEGGKSTGMVEERLSRMNGEVKLLLRGNHDELPIESYTKAGFAHVFPFDADVEASAGGVRITMRHKPLRTEAEKKIGTGGLYSKAGLQFAEEGFQRRLLLDVGNPEARRICALGGMRRIGGNLICGHVHQLFRRYIGGRAVNAGLDVWGMNPVRLDRLMRLLECDFKWDGGELFLLEKGGNAESYREFVESCGEREECWK